MLGSFVTRPALVRLKGKTDKPWMLVEALDFRTARGDDITVPAGFVTDFASVPWVFRRAIPKDGPWTYAAILHDWLCDTRPPGICSKRAAEIMSEAMSAEGCSAWQVGCMITAVKMFGPKW